MAAGVTTQTLFINDWLPEPLTNVSGDHWRKREKKLKAAQIMVWAAAKQFGLMPIPGRVKLTITLVFTINRRRDTDNLYARCKGLIDGLVKGGWITDDSTDLLNLTVCAVVETRKGTRLEMEPSPL